MKFFKITLAEIKKILLRPAFYIMIGCLFVAIIFSAFMFAPRQKTQYQSQISGSTLSVMNNNFNSSSSNIIDSKLSLDNRLNESFTLAEKFNERTDHEELKAQVGKVFKEVFYKLEPAIKYARYDVKILTDIYDASGKLLQYFDGIKNSGNMTNYIIKTEDFNRFNNLLKNLRNALPSSKNDISELQNNLTALSERCKLIWNSYKSQVDKMINDCNKIEPVIIRQDFFDNLDEFKKQTNSFLAQQQKDINLFYESNLEKESNTKNLLKFKTMLSDYKATVELAIKVNNNMLDLERLDTRTSNEKKYLGFEDTSLYKLNEDTTLYKYIIQEKLPYSKTLTAINFQDNSGIKTNGYDFAYFMIAIASLLMTLMFIYLASVTFAGEKHDGLMRMNLTKPCSRIKLYFAKITALISISFIAHMLIGILLLIIGVCIYGSASGSIMIAVFSANKAFIVAPFFNYIFKVFILFVTSLFYILLSSFISIILSNPVLSVVTSYLVYLFAILTNNFLAKGSFIKVMPFIHTDLSVFFGGGVWGTSFMSSLIYGGANFYLSFFYLIIFMAIVTISSCIIFKKQDF